MSKPALKPCPFCGGEAEIHIIEPHTHVLAKFMPDYGGGTFIECHGCTCIVSGAAEYEAIELWNRRAGCPPRELPGQAVDAITGGETERPDWRQQVMSRFEEVI